MATRIRPLARPRLVVLFAAAILVAGLAGTAGATNAPGFKTSKPPMLQAVAPRGWVDPIMSVGDDIGAYQFEAIPDGISIRRAPGHDKVEVYVNHETSTVPFPYTTTNPSALNSQNDFDNAQLSKLILDTDDAGVLQASMAITSAEGFQRFCSNFLATWVNGFDRPLLFTNEEAVDWVKRSGPTFWPATEGAADARQAGVVVALDPKTGERRPIWGMGRHNHENSLAVPGYKKPVVLSGDDTFVNVPSQSQLFSYIAANANAVWNDTGDLWAFVLDDSRLKYEDFILNDTAAPSGHFIQVPKLIATGRNPDGSEVMSDDAEAALGLASGTFAVPIDGSFSRPPGMTTGPSVDGPQWVLEKWSQMKGVFQFIRLEDMAYDKRPGMSNVVYVVDSGRATTGPASPVNTSPVKSTNGRIWKLVLDKTDPTKVTSLSILIEGDDNPIKTIGEIHQPDNIESTRRGLYITEDPGSGQQFRFDVPEQVNDKNRTPARIWQYKLSGGATNVVAVVDQSQDEAEGDADTTPRGSLGAWEASGIVDVSDYFGPGTFLVTVQAHTLYVEIADAGTWLNKREGGQLLLLRIPGA